MGSWEHSSLVAVGMMLATLFVCAQSVPPPDRLPYPLRCPPLCKISCRYGNVLDDDGCPICKCRGAPSPVKCPPVCAIFCPFGNVLDADGCPTCTCREVCPRNICLMWPKCPFGYKTINNCPSCECNKALPPEKCPPVCDIFCPFGKVLNDDGCPTCTCHDACPPVRCRLWPVCPFGYKTINNCPSCECNEAKECPLKDCHAWTRCAFGFLKVNGCPSCQCNSDPDIGPVG